MEIEKMHFDGQIWRPPYEASSQLLQVTAGCTYHKCKFCSLYHGTKFRLSPVSEVESDLKIIQEYQPKARRVFLTGANPFALSYNRLLDLGLLYLRLRRNHNFISTVLGLFYNTNWKERGIKIDGSHVNEYHGK